MVEFCPGKWNIRGTAVLPHHVTWAGVSCSLPVFWLRVLSLPSLFSLLLFMIVCLLGLYTRVWKAFSVEGQNVSLLVWWATHSPCCKYSVLSLDESSHKQYSNE